MSFKIDDDLRADRKPSLQKIPEPSLASAFLGHELITFDRDAKPPNIRALQREGFDWRWHELQWRTREKAREIIEGRRRWPRDLLYWKLCHEVRFFHRNRGAIPPWCDPRNLTAPQRDHLMQEERAWDRREAAILSGRFRGADGEVDEAALDAYAPHPNDLPEFKAAPAPLRLERPSLQSLKRFSRCRRAAQ